MPDLTCTVCGKKGIRVMKKHLRYCRKRSGGAPAQAPRKKSTPSAAPKTKKKPLEVSNVVVLLRKEAADLRERAEKLEAMAEEAESLL